MAEDARNRLLGWAGGMTVGVLWIAMAAATLWSAYEGYQNDRNDWGLAWGLVGVLLLAAGLSAIIGTWWHYRHTSRHHG